MHDINVIMQKKKTSGAKKKKLDRVDTSHSIRGCADVTDVLTSQEVTLVSRRQIPSLWANLIHFQFLQRRERACMQRLTRCKEYTHTHTHTQAKASVVQRKHRISGVFFPLPLFLIYPSVCRGRNYYWEVEQGSGFLRSQKGIPSEWWPEEVRSEAINYWGRKVTGL